MSVTIEEARQTHPRSQWLETDSPFMLIERVKYGSTVSWILWFTAEDGVRLRSFSRKCDATAVATALVPIQESMERIVVLKPGGPEQEERKRLVREVNVVYWQAIRNVAP